MKKKQESVFFDKPQVTVRRAKEAKKGRITITLKALPDLDFVGSLIGTATWRHKYARVRKGKGLEDTTRLTLYSFEDDKTSRGHYLALIQWGDASEVHVGESAVDLLCKVPSYSPAREGIKKLLCPSLHLNDTTDFSYLTELTRPPSLA